MRDREKGAELLQAISVHDAELRAIFGEDYESVVAVLWPGGTILKPSQSRNQ